MATFVKVGQRYINLDQVAAVVVINNGVEVFVAFSSGATDRFEEQEAFELLHQIEQSGKEV